MTIEINFDDDELPENGPTNEWWEGKCLLCHQPIRARYWMVMGKRMHGTVHEGCCDRYERELHGQKTEQVAIPERFKEWDTEKFPDKQAFAAAQAFDPDSKYKTLALLGDPGKGKSRLMWQIVRQFFEVWAEQRRQSRWVEYFLFSDLATEYDQSRITKVKMSQFVFLDDLTELPPSRTKALIQEVVRYRVQTQKWTFLTIDKAEFDPDLIHHVCHERAVVVKVT